MIATGACETCGAPVERDEASGFAAALLNRLPFRCSGCSAVLEKEWAAEETERAELERERALEQKLDMLPPALRGWRLAELDDDGRGHALDAARRWAAGELAGLLLTGDVGVGKTTIAAAAFSARCRHGATAPRWLPVVEVLSDLARPFGSAERERALRALAERGGRALILDDLDKAKPTVAAASELFAAIDNCITHCRPLIVTTNLMPSELASRWPAHGKAIASRLSGYCELHKIAGADRRLLKRG